MTTTPPTDTAAALEAAIDAVIGAVRDDIGSDGMDASRTALDRAITAHIEAESIAAIDEFRRILTAPRAVGVPCPVCKVAARPTPDEARRLVEAFAAAHGALVLLMHGGQYDPFDDEGTRRSAADTARTALLRALGVEA